MIKTFRRGESTFTCRQCGKLTRNVTGTNGAVGMCPLCTSKAECGNSLSDAGHEGDSWAVFDHCKTPKECEALLEIEREKLN